jgi:exodeoxyribonuclease-3
VKIATFNCNSVRVRLGQIASWLAREAPDVLCLQETKVQDQDFPVAAFRNAGYHVVFRGRKAYAGVAIASREEPREVAFGLGCGSGFSPDDCGEPDEDRLIRAAIGGVTVVNTYVPQGRSADSPHFASKLEWLRRFRRLLEREYSPAEPLVWCGDLNVAPEPIDVHDPKRLKEHPDFHPLARAALEEVRAWGFTDVYRLFFPNAPGHYTLLGLPLQRHAREERGLARRPHLGHPPPDGTGPARLDRRQGPKSGAAVGSHVCGRRVR